MSSLIVLQPYQFLYCPDRNKKSRVRRYSLPRLFGHNQRYGPDEYCNRYMRSLRQRHTMAKPIRTRAMRVKASLNAHVIRGSTILNASKIRTNINAKMTKFLSNPIRRSPFLALLFQSGFEFSQLIIKLIFRVELVKLLFQTGLTHFVEGFSLRLRIKHFVLNPIKSV